MARPGDSIYFPELEQCLKGEKVLLYVNNHPETWALLKCAVTDKLA